VIRGDKSFPQNRLLLQRQIDIRNRPFGFDGDLEKDCRDEIEHRRDDVCREDLLGNVELRGDVVVELPREGDLVFRARQFFLKLFHVLIRFQVRIVLHEGEEFVQCAGEHIFFGGGIGDSLRRDGGVPRLNDFLQRLLLEFHLSLHRLDKVRDEVVAPFQLNVDLFPAVGNLIAERDESVVFCDDPEDENERCSDKKIEENHECVPFVKFTAVR